MSTITSNPSKDNLDLSRAEDVLTYLAETPFTSTHAERLSGGVGNFVFRCHLVKPLEGAGCAKTVIVKHAKPWVAGNESFPLDIERQNVEAAALKHVHALLPSDSVATVPALLHHDPEAHVLIMEDAGQGARNLKDLLRESPLSESASRELGSALGRFLAAIHVQGSADAELLDKVRENDIGRKITAWLTYGRLVDTIKRSGQDAGIVEPPLASTEVPSETQLAEISTLVDSTVKKIFEAQTMFTMGDFWTGNVVVRLTERGDIERVFVIDWEVAKPGLPFLDFAQFTAEMHTLRRFSPEANASVTTALNGFKEAYSRNVQVDEEFVRSAASHVGAHMVTVTPDVENWGPKEKRREVLKEGIEYVLGGLLGDSQWLETSVVDHNAVRYHKGPV